MKTTAQLQADAVRKLRTYEIEAEQCERVYQQMVEFQKRYRACRRDLNDAKKAYNAAVAKWARARSR